MRTLRVQKCPQRNVDIFDPPPMHCLTPFLPSKINVKIIKKEKMDVQGTWVRSDVVTDVIDSLYVDYIDSTFFMIYDYHSLVTASAFNSRNLVNPKRGT